MGLLETRPPSLPVHRGALAPGGQIPRRGGCRRRRQLPQKAPARHKVVAEIEAAGGAPQPSARDLTTQEGVQALASAAMENFGSLDLLVLNASGGMESGMEEGYALKLNRDAQVNMLNAAVPLMPRFARGVRDQPQAHFIETVPTMPEYEPVARSKRAGEDALVNTFRASAERASSWWSSQ